MTQLLPQTFSFQTRIELDSVTNEILCEYARLYSTMKHSLFADMMRGHASKDLKNSYLKRFGVTARNFNACRCEVEGAIQSVKELQKLELTQLKEKISGLQKKIVSLSRGKKLSASN